MDTHQTHTLLLNKQHSDLVELCEEIAQETREKDEEGVQNGARRQQ